ncbi:MAG: hypothetical protein ABH830_00815, partial [Patescibacteria group bacterium]
MQKLLTYSLVFAVALAMSGVNAFASVNETSISTGFTRDSAGGQNPIIKVKWEANADRYTDALPTAGAQLNASGQYQVNKTIAICAIVTDPDGLADIDRVYADVFYPVGIALGDSHVPLADQSGDGCGELMQEDSMTKLAKAAGIDLFCNMVRNNNSNLPTWNTGYNYDEICKADGELQKETAAVFCAQKDLSYEDPSGDYRVLILAQDKNGLDGTLENTFKYLETTAFQTDFTSVSYGPVKLNTHKIINGDLTWGPTLASVRNVGNTRLNMRVWQNDMGLGKTDGNWNVKFDARVGSNATWKNYNPETTTTLNDSLDLSELDEMDFSIEIYKFPPEHTGPYAGTMTLSAVKTAHLT